jgi:hypothetical protein
VFRRHVEYGPARPDSSPGPRSPHCSPRLYSCPPACLQCMGSARANRSGRSPESG